MNLKKHKERVSKKTINILIVDDEKNMREALRLGLSMQKIFSVREATNGREALEDVAVNKPDIILLDMAMPVMDGVQTYRRLKNDPRTKDIPVIFLTARTYQDIAQDLAIGVDQYMEKPFEFAALCVRINELLEGLC